MKNCRKSVSFFFLSVFFIAFSVSARAQTVEERKAAANYDETFPASEKAQVVEETPSAPQVPAGARPAQTIVPPVQVAPGTTPEVQPVPAVSKAVPRDMPEDQVFAASNPSGLVELSGFKYPVFLFAPKDYKTDMTYAMIMIAPAESAKAEKQVEYLKELAQREGIFILAPYVLWPKSGDTPYTLDAWLLTVKKDVMERFPISKKRVYLVGKDSGANYAAYMAVKYPKEFAAAALLGEAWAGPFSQLIQPRADAADQVPFYIAFKADGNARERNDDWLGKFQQKGYPLRLVDYKNDEDLNDLKFKKAVFDWMETTGESWKASVARGQQTWKGKFKKGVKDFFAV
ncbi:MAG: hypothetical protein WC530_04845 [Candidatus Omnitrophota bacterium]|jgi:hypothetical protein